VCPDEVSQGGRVEGEGLTGETTVEGAGVAIGFGVWVVGSWKG
jgi:hypothetical protein